MKNWNQEEWSGKVRQDAGEIGHTADSEEEKKAREKAVYYLQFSGKTESELRRKLAEQGFSPASVDSAVEYVKAHRYLDDEDYVRRFVEKNGRKKSRRQMEYELSGKGIAKEVLSKVFEDVQIDEKEQILAILEKRNYPRGEDSREQRQKIFGYLARKGFSGDDITAALIQFARKTTD